MRPGHAEERGQAGPQVVKRGFPGQPIAERGHTLTGLSVGTPEPVFVLLNDMENPHADGHLHADAVVVEAVGSLAHPLQ